MNTFCAGKVIEPTEKEATLEKKKYIYIKAEKVKKSAFRNQ